MWVKKTGYMDTPPSLHTHTRLLCSCNICQVTFRNGEGETIAVGSRLVHSVMLATLTLLQLENRQVLPLSLSGRVRYSRTVAANYCYTI